LGDAFGGTCHAQPSELTQPTEPRQRELCNCGYARGRCDRFPGGDADAVRFSVTGDTPSQLSLIYVVEKDHAPAEFGTLQYSVDGALLEGPNIGEVRVQQARAFLQSYLRRRALSTHA
jgi:hypothetical protein